MKNKWFRRVPDGIRALMQMQITTHAAHSCYFLILSAFPALLLIISLLRYTGLDIQNLTDLLEGFIPEAIMGYIRRIIESTYKNSTGAVVSLSALTALWSASRGVHGLMTGLNAIYDVAEDRSYWATRGISVLYTFLFLIVLLLTLVLHVFGNTILGWLYRWDIPFVGLVRDIVDLRFFLLLFIQTVLFTTMYAVLPNKRNRVWDSFPGAVLASIGWLVFSDLFSIYVENFNRYANIYGSVYTVALSMLWLLCCVSILFYGGALNRLMAFWRKNGE